MADQYASKDQNEIPALLAHSGTAGTAETRRVVAGENGELLTRLIGGTISPILYDYSGGTTIGSYTYYGFKQRNGVNWYIMRINDTYDNEILYSYGTSGTAGFATAWADPSLLNYSLPSDT